MILYVDAALVQVHSQNTESAANRRRRWGQGIAKSGTDPPDDFS